MFEYDLGRGSGDSMSVLLSDVVSGSAVGLRGRLWRLSASELRAAAVSASAEILRLEAVRVAVVDELSMRPDDQVIASPRGGLLVGGKHDAAGSGREEDRRVWVRRCGRFRRWRLGSMAGIARSSTPC